MGQINIAIFVRHYFRNRGSFFAYFICGMFCLSVERAYAEPIEQKNLTTHSNVEIKQVATNNELSLNNLDVKRIEAQITQLEAVRLTEQARIVVETDALLPLLSRMPRALQYRLVQLKAQSWAMAGNMEAAENLLQRYLKTPPSTLFIEQHVDLLLLLAGVYSDSYDVESTLKVLNQIVPFLAQVNDANDEAYVYMLMVEMLTRMTRYQAAGQYTDKLFSTLEKVKKPIRRCYISTVHANAVIHLLVDDLSQREYLVSLFRHSFNECEQAEDKGAMSINLRSLTEVYLLDNRLLLATAAIDKAYQMALIEDNTSELAFIYAHLADIAKREDKFDTAIEYASQSYDLAIELKIDHLMTKASLLLAETYELSGDTAQALLYRQVYEERYLIQWQTTQGELTVFESAKLQLLNSERQLDVLEREKAQYLMAKEMVERKQTQIRLWMTLLMGSIGFLMIWIVMSVKQKRRYRVLAQSDPLTGIYNRSAGEYVGKILYEQARKVQQPFSLVSFDIDNFKAINDHFGHGTGDWVLKKIVNEITGKLREDDVFVRMGGEEFMILLPGLNETQAWKVATTCRLMIENLDTHYSGHEFSITASFGVTQGVEPDLQLDMLVKRADELMGSSQKNHLEPSADTLSYS
ncbi:tetratricopeptide repeat-containing diguanylate cyclase [uncultured Shewanella sp.]|uniref:GGDEF domain-containing protein n=1 Tax=uncultured Shewanella sp. TaxID=173975 RepID=UPI00263751B1|nr:tetratricopeptide repeat-containing diguanylate cyclase [uncultured Shewanella sp.]